MRRTDESGFTLVELLVTVVIVGTAFVVLVGGTLTGVIASNTHREKADGEIVLRRFIDYVKNESTAFHGCPLSAEDYIPTPPPSWAKDYSLRIEATDPADTTTHGCEMITPVDPGKSVAQKLTLVVEPKDAAGVPDFHGRLAVQIVKRSVVPGGATP